jgi:SAM-dependent methyltransferase
LSIEVVSDDAKITGETVRADFNAVDAVVHYARAAHFLGLWDSERILIERYFPDRSARLLEAGCGAGRGAVGLWHLGYRRITAFDFAAEMIEQARSLTVEQGIDGIEFLVADATDLTAANSPAQNPAVENAADPKPVGARAPQRPMWTVEGNGPDPEPAQLGTCHIMYDKFFDGALFLFNGLMQIPGRENRRQAMRELQRVCRPGAHFIFTTHDRDADAIERDAWRKEAEAWERGEQNPRLVEFGDRYFVHENGQTFMHLPDRAEILEDLASSGWTHSEDAMRDEIVRERRAVREFSDNCRFWVVRKN